MNKIGVIVPIIGFGRKGFYNSQEIGLGKALSKRNLDVTIIKFLKRENNIKDEEQEIDKNLRIVYHYSAHLGVHAHLNTEVLDSSWDAIIVFSDNQLCIPKLNRWCKKNQVKLLPYVGIVHSFGDGFIKRIIMDTLFSVGTCSVYKKQIVMVKNKYVQSDLKKRGVCSTILAPVGLDYSVLHCCNAENKQLIRRQMGFGEKDKIVLFVGILTYEKNPLGALHIIKRLHEENSIYKMILIGKGDLKTKVIQFINENNMQDYVKYIEEVPNDSIWKFYYCADIYINLWEQEIFGMAILEALYYKNFVVAIRAPGPNTILQYMSGCILCNSCSEVIEGVKEISIKNSTVLEENLRMLDMHFNWDAVSEKFKREIYGK